MSDAGYIAFPVEIDYDTLLANALDAFATAVPGWVAREGDLIVQLFEVIARMDMETGNVAALVPPGIFRYFGRNLVNIQPIDAVSATVPSTWTTNDTAGHTIKSGTQVAIPVDGDTAAFFTVQTDVTIAPGDSTTSTGEVTLVAVTPGTASNGLAAGPAYVTESLVWVGTITTNATTAGGVDPETDSAYLKRLAAELRLTTPRPIRPDDFAVMALNRPGVARAHAVDGYDIGVNEKQQVAITGSPTGGTFTLTYSGQTTGAIAYNASASAVQSALEALANIAVGDVSVTGGALPASPVIVEFTGSLASSNVSAMTATGSLTGGSTPAVTVTTTQGGVAPSTENERMVAVALVDTDGNPVSSGIKTDVKNYLEGQREVNFVVHVMDPSYQDVDVTVTVHKLATANSSTVHDLCVAALQAYLNPTNWDWRGVVRVNELISLLDRVAGVDYVITPTVPSADVTLSGAAPLPRAGTITVTVA